MDTDLITLADQSAIRDLLARVNHAWVEQRGDAMTAALNECFSEDAVMRGPGLVLLGRGRDFVVDSYRTFAAQAEIKRFSLEPRETDIFGDVAAAQYKWSMTYVLSGQEYTEQGFDLFMLARRQGAWLIVWRAMLPDQPA